MLLILIVARICCSGRESRPANNLRGRFRERRRADRYQDNVESRVAAPLQKEEQDKGEQLLSLNANEYADAYDCTELMRRYDIEIGEAIKPHSESVSFVGFDDLFPDCGLSDLFHTNASFRTAIRMAARYDFSQLRDDDPDTEAGANRRFNTHDSGRDSIMKFWLDDERMWRQNLLFCQLTTVFQNYLPHSNLDGDTFMTTLINLCGDEPKFGSWMDIVGVLEKNLEHAWHQDSGFSHKTVMVGFPISNNYEGLGVFSHAVKLSHRLKEPELAGKGDVPGPRTWPLREMMIEEDCGTSPSDGKRRRDSDIIAAESVRRLQFSDKYIIRPVFRKGKEIMIYDDSKVFHSAPDYARRESLWRFM